MKPRQTRKIPGSVEEARAFLDERLGPHAAAFLEVAQFGAAIGAQLGLLQDLLPHAERFSDKVDDLPGAHYHAVSLPNALKALFSPGKEPLIRTLADLPALTLRYQAHQRNVNPLNPSRSANAIALSPLRFHPSTRFAHSSRFDRAIPLAYSSGDQMTPTVFAERIRSTARLSGTASSGRSRRCLRNGTGFDARRFSTQAMR